MSDIVRPYFRSGKLIAVEEIKENLWECKCDCGGGYIADSKQLLTFQKIHCGCEDEEYETKFHQKGKRWKKIAENRRYQRLTTPDWSGQRRGTE